MINPRIFIENNASELSTVNALSYFLEQEIETLFNEAKEKDKLKMHHILALVQLLERQTQSVEDSLFKLVDRMTEKNYDVLI